MKIPLTYKRPGRISLRYVKDAAGHEHKPAGHIAARPRTDYAAAHAPAGGVTIGGKPFKGGQFIPAEVMAKATPEERAAVASGDARGKPLPPPGGAKLRGPAKRPQVGRFGDCTNLAFLENKKTGADVYHGYAVPKEGLQRAREYHEKMVREYGAEATGPFTLAGSGAIPHAWNVQDGRVVDRALGATGSDYLYFGEKIPQDALNRMTHGDEIAKLPFPTVVVPQVPETPPTPTTSPATGPAAVDHTSPEAFATSLADAYGAAGHDPALARAVSARFPAHVRTRLARGLKTVRVHPSVEGVVESFYADDPTGRLASVPPDKRQRTLGFYDASQRHLETDGGPDPAGTLAHELGHAADYEGDWDLSSSDEFRYAWFREIKGGRLTAYAATEPAEGFAELFRFLYGQDGDTSGVAAQLFPLCHAFFKKHGLV